MHVLGALDKSLTLSVNSNKIMYDYISRLRMQETLFQGMGLTEREESSSPVFFNPPGELHSSSLPQFTFRSDGCFVNPPPL